MVFPDHTACTNPGNIIGGGRSRPIHHKIFSPQFIEVQWVLFKENYNLPRLQGGGGGSNCLFPIGTQITCDFPGSGFRPPVPPLDPHMKTHSSDVLLKV